MRILPVALLFTMAAAHARAAEPGLDVAVGLGPAFGGGLGASVGFGFGVSTLLHFIPYLGLGFLADPHVDHGENQGQPGVAGGVLTTVGEKHRLALDLSYGTTGWEYLTVHGYRLARTSAGPSVLVGYGYSTKNGFLARAEGGLSFPVAPYSPEGHSMLPTFCVAVGKTF